MAKVVEGFDRGRDRRSNRYPWDEWLDGRVWRLIEGEDFDVHKVTMKNAVYVAAMRRGGKARIQTSPDGLTIQFLKKPETV